MDYLTLTMGEAATATEEIAAEALNVFGSLDQRQMNWKPAPERWSIAQCFDHLAASTRLMRESAERALRDPRRTIWQRLPGWPGFFGRLMVRTQGPQVKGKYKSPSKSTPASSELGADTLHRFVDQNRELAAWMRAVGDEKAAATIQVSPFVGIVTYSILDASRLVAAHDRRHFEQARRVMQSPGFPQRQ